MSITKPILLITCLALLADLAACRHVPVSDTPVEVAAAKSVPPVGAAAPAFSLLDHEGNRRTLSAFEGRWVVLYFYPEDQTPACTQQARDFTRRAQAFLALNAVVLGVSPNTTYEHQLFHARHDLGVTLMSDAQGTLMQRYGAWRITRWRDQTAHRVNRSTCLIDPDGRIAYGWPHVEPIGHAERVLVRLHQIQQSRR